ncbi:Predicted thiol-disulfide oxidoreductase YuxK, DCC family [Seinonella peptonophila]|uniref:Predicted thiol-disulfide oxidoreductase YuxK, DCC family n=1 Tax=Seinonella peptonophila TaxID=112248 RepID=A0A1M4VHR9_9BACL|nr:thiol-disulfide oxidoreductase DCC family protein [Seinonella peptonophila]SHE68440.1 Predicted thiol-disulfide oxidoreductase YuxK, DCC family [Seinonella peptonophila]
MKHHDSTKHPIVLFDGVCNFCSGWVRFLIERDSKSVLRFASLQSEIAKELLSEHQISHPNLDTIVLIENENIYTRSTAVLRILGHLDGGWRWFKHLSWIPRPVRDLGYRIFAKYRYRLFGTEESCLYPSRNVRERFLEITN